MRKPALRASRLISILLGIAVPFLISAARVDVSEDVQYAAEHLAEAAQDALYYALPWPDGDNVSSSWKPLAAVGYTSIDGGIGKASGTLFTAGAERAWSRRWRSTFFAFYDQFDVGGAASENVVSSKGLSGVPLDLPANAELTDPRGTFRHFGAGALIARRDAA